MVTEVAILEIKPGTETDFELAFAKAELVINQAKGYIRHSMQRCLETETKYLLLVQWTSLEAHTTGFRQSALFTEWRALIGPFFDKAPVVEHYKTLNS